MDLFQEKYLIIVDELVEYLYLTFLHGNSSSMLISNYSFNVHLIKFRRKIVQIQRIFGS